MIHGPTFTQTYPYPGWSIGSKDTISIKVDDRLLPYDPASPLPVVSFVNREVGTVCRYNYDTSRPLFTSGTIKIYGR